MFAKLYSYIWGETDTEAIVTQSLQPECMTGSFIEKIENIPSANQIDEGCQIHETINHDETMQTDCISDCEEAEIENGWVHVKDYKVEALSDNESCISAGVENEQKKEDIAPLQIAIKTDNGNSRVLKVKLNKRRKECKKREVQSTANSARLEIPLLQELFYKKDEHNLDQQNSDRRMTRKAMKMSNSNALVNSSSNKPSRRRFYYTPNGFSGAVNNRKC